MNPLLPPVMASCLVLIPLLQGCSPASHHLADKSPRPVRAQVLTQAEDTERLSLPAMLEPRQQADLAFRVAGPVQDILVQEGQQVAKGQVLMRLNPHDFEVQVAEYQARLVEAQAQARQAKLERDRVAAAGRDDAIARVELDRANTAVERSNAAVTVVRQRLQMVQDALSYATLTAPFDGVISRVAIESHEQAVPASTVLTLHGDSGFQVRVDLPEQLASRVSIGMSAELRLNGYPEPLTVTVSELRRSASLMSRTFRMTAELAEQPQGAWPEQTGLMHLTLPTLTAPGYLLPSSALQSSGTGRYVTLVEQGRVRRVAVTMLGFEQDRVRVGGDLKQGDVVVTAGAPYFEDGDEVGQVLLPHRQIEL